MKRNALILLLIAAFTFTACSKDDSSDENLETTTYQLNAVNSSGVTGTVTVSETKDGFSKIDIKLDGSTTDVHPAYVFHGNVSQDTDIAITLNACTCDVSSTVVTELDSGAKISYNGFKAFNGNVRILQSKTDDTVVASGNIGVNAN